MSLTVADSRRERPTAMPTAERGGAGVPRRVATASRLAPPGRRGQIVSTYFVACYGGLIVPVVGVGIASGFIGDFPAVLALSVLLAALCLFALAGVGRTPAPDGTMVSR